MRAGIGNTQEVGAVGEACVARRVTGDIACCAGVPGRVAARPCWFRFGGAVAGDAVHRFGWICSTPGKDIRNRAASG